MAYFYYFSYHNMPKENLLVESLKSTSKDYRKKTLEMSYLANWKVLTLINWFQFCLACCLSTFAT